MISRRLNIPTQRFLFALERRHSFWFGSRFYKRLTWSAGARIPDVTSFTLIVCVLRTCETHCLRESDYIGVYTLLLFCEYHWFIDLPSQCQQKSCCGGVGWESMTTHRQTTGRHDNSATALFHRQPTRRHDHWLTRQVTDTFFKNSPTLADTHRQRLS